MNVLIPSSDFVSSRYCKVISIRSGFSNASRLGLRNGATCLSLPDWSMRVIVSWGNVESNWLGVNASLYPFSGWMYTEDDLRGSPESSQCLKMSSLLNNTRRLVSVVVGVLIFTVWIFVDLLLLPSILAVFGYGLYEPIAFGSWFVIILVILCICIWGSMNSTE